MWQAAPYFQDSVFGDMEIIRQAVNVYDDRERFVFELIGAHWISPDGRGFGVAGILIVVLPAAIKPFFL